MKQFQTKKTYPRYKSNSDTYTLIYTGKHKNGHLGMTWICSVCDK